MIKFLLIVFLLLASTCAICDGTASFVAKAKPGWLEIEGNGAEVLGKPVRKGKFISGEFSVLLNTITTGVDLRDEHMKKNYLEIDKYPKATFVLDPLLYAVSENREFTGTLELHGVKQTVKGLVDFTASKANAEFSIDLTKFGISVPTYKVLTVGKEVVVKVVLSI